MTKTLVERLEEKAVGHSLIYGGLGIYQEAKSRIEELERHLTGMCDAYELLCQQARMPYHESPSSKYVAARQALSDKG
jgi:hypothetical protein